MLHSGSCYEGGSPRLGLSESVSVDTIANIPELVKSGKLKVLTLCFHGKRSSIMAQQLREASIPSQHFVSGLDGMEQVEKGVISRLSERQYKALFHHEKPSSEKIIQAISQVPVIAILLTPSELDPGTRSMIQQLKEQARKFGTRVLENADIPSIITTLKELPFKKNSSRE